MMIPVVDDLMDNSLVKWMGYVKLVLIRIKRGCVARP